MAIYDHRLPPGATLSPEDGAARAILTQIVAAEIARALGRAPDAVAPLARSLIALVHGHCSFALTGAFELMEEADPEGAALARVRECLAAA